MVAAPEIHFAQWGIGWELVRMSAGKATVDVDMQIEKHTAATQPLRIHSTLYDAQGKAVAHATQTVRELAPGTVRRSLRLSISHPHAWDLDRPYLYTLKTELLSGAERYLPLHHNHLYRIPSSPCY